MKIIKIDTKFELNLIQIGKFVQISKSFILAKTNKIFMMKDIVKRKVRSGADKYGQ